MEIIECQSGATSGDCLFDVYQYLIMWAWYFPLVTGLMVFAGWAIGYFILLLYLVDDKGNARRL